MICADCKQEIERMSSTSYWYQDTSGSRFCAYQFPHVPEGGKLK